MRAGPQVTHAQALNLIKPISLEEVMDALHEIDDTKSLWLKGFTSLFFLRNLGILLNMIS